MKCSDIPDQVFLDAVSEVARRRGEASGMPWWSTANRWDVARVLGGQADLVGADAPITDVPGWPERLVLAKARKLIRRGLLDGCFCGCRGDFEIPASGEEGM